MQFQPLELATQIASPLHLDDWVSSEKIAVNLPRFDRTSAVKVAGSRIGEFVAIHYPTDQRGRRQITHLFTPTRNHCGWLDTILTEDWITAIQHEALLRKYVNDPKILDPDLSGDSCSKEGRLQAGDKQSDPVNSPEATQAQLPLTTKAAQ